MTQQYETTEHESSGLPSPDAHAVAAVEPEPLDAVFRRILRRREVTAISHEEAIANLLTAVARNAWPITDRDYHPLPVRRSELVQQLEARRDNDVYVYVPVDGREPVRLGIAQVAYLREHDQIALITSPWYLGVEPDGDSWTPWLTLTGGDIEHLLVDHHGIVLQAQDTKDEETAHPLSVGDCDGDDCDVEDIDDELIFDGDDPADDNEGSDELEDNAPLCVLLISPAFGDGVLHLPRDQRAAVRIGAA